MKIRLPKNTRVSA